MDRQSFEALSFALDVVFKATLLIGFAGLVRLFLRRASASLRQAIGVLTLGALLALPAIAPMLPDWKVPVIPTLLTGPEAQAEPARGWIERTAHSETIRSTARPEPAVVNGAPSAGLDRSATLERTADFGYGVVPEPEVQPVASSRAAVPWPSAGTLTTLLFLIWGAGATALLLHLALGLRRVRRYAQRAEPAGDERWAELSREISERLGLTRRVRFFFTNEVPVAVTAGHFRPMLLLPQAARRWSPELRRVVVLHELAHVRRGDWGVLLLAHVAAAIYWFHPLVWLGVGQLRRDSEQAADDLVLRSGTKPSVYAGHLLGIIRSLRDAPAPSPLPVMGVARPSQFEARLKAILDPAASRREASPGQVRLAASFAAAAVLTLGALQPWKSAEAAVPPSLWSEGSSEQIAEDSECDSKKQEKKDAEAEEAAVVASLPEDSDFARVSAEEDGSLSTDEGSVDSDADSYGHGEADGTAVPAVLDVPAQGDTPARSEKGFVQAGRRSPRDGDDWYDRGMHHHRDGEYDEAIAAFQKSIDEGHKEGAASYNIACGYALKGDANRAFEWLDRAMEAGFDVSQYIGQDDDLESLESDPRFAKYKQKAREVRRELKRKQIEHKLARYERLTRDDPKNGAAWYKLGYELYELGEHDRAAKAFQQSAALHHNESASLYNAACMLSLAGDRRSALDHLERAILAGFGSADKLREDDDLDNIRSEPRYRELLRLAEALEMPSIEQWGWNKFARSKSKVQEQWREAADEIEKFTRQHPEIGRAWFNLGFARIQSGQPEQAVPAFQKALDLGHRKATSMYNLACAHALLDQKDPAFDWLFRAIEAGAGKGMVRRDPDLDNLRGHPRYREALRLAESKHGKDHDD